VNPIRNVLVIVDPTAESQSAVVKGALLARKFGARLELYACETKASREMRLAAHLKKDAGKPFVVNLKSILEELAAPLRAQGLDVTTETDTADPLHEALIARTKRTSAEIVIKDTHHHSIARRTFLTNTDWHLIRECPVPLLLAKPRPWVTFPTVLAAVDPGHANDKPAALDARILDVASAVTKALGGQLHVLHAYFPVAIASAAAAGSLPFVMTVSAEDLAFEERRKREQLQMLAAEYRVDPAHIHVEIGSPVEALPRIASAASADIVVMGAISRSGVSRAFIGSTAEDTLEQLPCDALIVKPPDFLLPL
jgi:universal stress protein E